jgi:branched-chain amino acid transport system ATP-binding protein
LSAPRLRTIELVKRFGGLLATDRVSIDVQEGEIHALIGPNGAGKTTLIGQLTGELRSDAGKVLLDGEDISRLSAASRVRRGMARTFQITQLLPEYTVIEHLRLSLLAQARRTGRLFGQGSRDAELRRTALERLEAADLAHLAEVRVAELSHGQRKQLELSIALALEPRLLLLDEPMAGLGPAESLAMTERLGRLRGRLPMLLIEHDMDAVFALADRVSVLVSGACIATGPAEQIRNDARVRQAYLGDGDD